MCNCALFWLKNRVNAAGRRRRALNVDFPEEKKAFKGTSLFLIFDFLRTSTFKKAPSVLYCTVLLLFHLRSSGFNGFFFHLRTSGFVLSVFTKRSSCMSATSDRHTIKKNEILFFLSIQDPVCGILCLNKGQTVESVLRLR